MPASASMLRLPRSATLLSLSLLTTSGLFGCSRQGTEPVKSAHAENEAPAQAALPALEGSSGPIATRQSPRRVGDIWVHRFSGSFRKSALILREEVIAQAGETLIVDYLLDDQGKETHLRVTMAARSERILEVAKIRGEEILPGSISDFEAMMAKTTFVPDRNTGRVASTKQTCLVGKDAMDCELAEYKVLLGEEEARLKVARSDALRRDLSGEITAVDGTIVYKAELVEMQRGEESPIAPTDGVALKGTVDFDARD